MRAIPVWLLVLALAWAGCKSGEHPEHPQAPKAAGVTKDQVADAVEAYVAEHLTDGRFVVEDKEKGKTLRLTLDKVHRERLAHMGGGRYFVCADMRNEDGTLYDLDFFVVMDKDGKLTLDSEIWVHKEAGKPRYQWVEEEGIWKRKALGAPAEGEHPKKKQPEHPEHPKD